MSARASPRSYARDNTDAAGQSGAHNPIAKMDFQ